MIKKSLPRACVPLVLLTITASIEAQAALPSTTAGPATAAAAVDRALVVYFKRKPGRGRLAGLRGGDVAPVLVHFASPPTPDDARALEAVGLHVERRSDGSPRGYGSVIAADLPATSLPAAALVRGVRAITLDTAPFAPPPPLDGTTAEIQAVDAWRSTREPTGPLTGKGVVVCDIDSGVDPFHPMLFRADGGYVAWVDVDNDGKFTPGTDAVDLKGDGQATALRVLNTSVTNYFDEEPLFGSDDPAYEVGMDWLYADVNGNGQRDFGPGAGFTEADPTYGERLFVADDVNQNGVVDVGEKLVALGTSKIKVLRQDKKKYRRGVNLLDAPPNPSAAHGTGASGVMLGGDIGLTRLVGVAPDAELVMATNTDGTGDVALADFCVDEGARVVLHEYAPWVGYHLDGSSGLESFIDDTVKSKNVAHINPAGNLSTSNKLYKKTIPAGEETVIKIEAPTQSFFGPFHLMYVSILWREPSRPLSITLEDPTGVTKAVATTTGQVISDSWIPGLAFQSIRDDSSRGTARSDIYIYEDEQSPTPKLVPLGTWKLHITDAAPAGSPGLQLFGYVLDEASGWGQGIYFPEDSSEDHLIGYPGTADHGLAVAAYTGHGWNGGVPGERAGYSGRGRRIDGTSILWISAPDDPITSGYREGSPGVDFIYGGTSGASPHVAGAAALLLQADPSRTGDDVRDAIKAGALVDPDVGAAPNEDYGNGKLRVYKSLFGEDPPGGSPPSISVPKTTVELGDTAEIAIDVSDIDESKGGLRVEVDRDYDGVFEEVLPEQTLAVKAEALGIFTSKVRVTDATGRASSALAVVEVVPKVVVTPPPPSPPLVAGGGCDCALRGERGEASNFSLASFVWLALAALVRRRRAPRFGPN